MKRRIGVLGGMGPESTLWFYQQIINLSLAEKDQDHLEAIIAMLPSIPDRTAAILGYGEDPTPSILAGLNLLSVAGAELAVIICNTAHQFLPPIMDEIPIPVINMIECVANDIKKRQITKVGLLATDGTLQTGLYDRYLSAVGVSVLKPNILYQEKIMEIIYGTKGVKVGYTGNSNRLKLLDCVGYLNDQGAEAVILGCTELPLVLRKKDKTPFLLNPLEILAKQVIKIANS